MTQISDGDRSIHLNLGIVLQNDREEGEEDEEEEVVIEDEKGD